jgi:hypothetical protein
MDDWITVLHDLASKLLEHAEAIDSQLGEATPDQNAIRDSLEKLCKALSEAVTLLEATDSPLDTLVKKIDKSPVALPMEALAQYIEDHRKALERLGIASKTIDKIVAALQAPARSGNTALNLPQTLECEDALDPLRELRDWICDMAKVANIADLDGACPTKIAVRGGWALHRRGHHECGHAAPVTHRLGAVQGGQRSGRVWARCELRCGSARLGRVKNLIEKRTKAQVDEKQRKLKEGAPNRFHLGGKSKGKPPQG